MFSNKQWGYNQVSWGHSKGCMGYVTSLTQHDSWICLETDMGQIGISQKKHPRTMIRSGNLTVCYWKCPIEIVDLPIQNGDFPYKSPFSHDFPMVFLFKMVIFYSFLYVYQGDKPRDSGVSIQDVPLNLVRLPSMRVIYALYMNIYIW